MIFVISTLTVHPGKQADCIAAAKPCLLETRKEAGCVSYDLHVSVSDLNTLVFVERWESPEHLAAHARAPHFLAWRATGAEFVASRNIEIIHPEKVTGL